MGKKARQTQLKQEEEQVKQEYKPHGKTVKIQKEKEVRGKGKKNRLIIRNLIFDLKEHHIRKLMAPFGDIVDLQVPVNPNNQQLNRGFAFVEFKDHRSCQKAVSQLNQSKYKGRPIILDYSLSKDRFMKSQADNTDPVENQLGQNKEEGDQIQKQNDGEQQNQEISQEEGEQEYVIKQQKTEAQIEEDLASQVFIRNVPITTSQEQLRKLFNRYGKVKYAKIVIDKATATPKGTAFVKFYENGNAKKLIEYSRAHEMCLLGKNKNFKADPKINLQVDGAVLKLFQVESRQGIADKIRDREDKDNKSKKKVKPLKRITKLRDLITYDKTGKRNLVLAQHGTWQPTQDMEGEEEQKFRMHYKDKIEKLKNPNHSVSDKRVVLKHLDKDITETQIRDLAFQFLKYYQLPRKELTYCKLMLDPDRKKSAGFAFLQFAQHQNALNFIEQLSAEHTALMPSRFVVEFAIQDSRKMQKLKFRNQQPKPQ